MVWTWFSTRSIFIRTNGSVHTLRSARRKKTIEQVKGWHTKTGKQSSEKLSTAQVIRRYYSIPIER
jgi:hypothetical protein